MKICIFLLTFFTYSMSHKNNQDFIKKIENSLNTLILKKYYGRF